MVKACPLLCRHINCASTCANQMAGSTGHKGGIPSEPRRRWRWAAPVAAVLKVVPLVEAVRPWGDDTQRRALLFE